MFDCWRVTIKLSIINEQLRYDLRISPQLSGRYTGQLIDFANVKSLVASTPVFATWGWVKTLVPSEPQNSW
jgi:hypothetical protein